MERRSPGKGGLKQSSFSLLRVVEALVSECIFVWTDVSSAEMASGVVVFSRL